MATVNHCPSCGADASHRQLDLENESSVYCSSCGHVLDDIEFQHDFFEPSLRPVVNGQIVVSTTPMRYPPKLFHISNGTCREFRRLAPHFQLSSNDIQMGYTYIKRFVDEYKPVQTTVTAVAVAYLLRRLKMKPMPLRTCASLCLVSDVAVGSEYRRLLYVIKPVFPEGYWDPYLYLHDAATHNYKILALENGKESDSFTLAALTNLASDILNTASQSLYHTGRCSSSFVVSCLLLASDVLAECATTGANRRKVLKKLATANFMSDSVLDKRYSELRKLFSVRAEKLPWMAGQAKKCKDPTPFIRDVLNLEGVALHTTLPEGSERSESQHAEDDNEQCARNYPPAFVRSEEKRQHLEGKIEFILGESSTVPLDEDEQDLKTLAFLLENGISKEELLKTNEADRQRLEHSIHYRDQFPWSYNAHRDLDNATLDDKDLCDEEINMYLRTK